ncbi:hypothetical protein EYF80_049497 [Liparis tanakae]|uniref:Uncharacterized protein n=1 Tax=Liparis tanakae TaxID=230148 RepID=A0A4Z2FHF6_9TELE|nr:hypothetical protein EYF80_049497 [Liparis tanakae]
MWRSWDSSSSSPLLLPHKPKVRRGWPRADGGRRKAPCWAIGNKAEGEKDEEVGWEEFVLLLDPSAESSVSSDGRPALCVPLRALPGAESGVAGGGASRLLNIRAVDADGGSVAG